MDTLPARPAIPGRYTVIDISPDECLLVSSTGSFSIATKEHGLLQQLAPMLTGENATPDIVSRLEHIGEDRVLAALHQLHDAGVLEDAALLDESRLSPSDLQRHRGQIAFFGTFARDSIGSTTAPSQLWPDIPVHGVEYQERLANASILIHGLGQTGSLLARNLAHAGVGRIAAIDSAVVSIDDAHSPAWYGVEHAGQSRHAALASLIQSSNVSTSYSPIPVEQGLASLRGSDLAGYTFAVLCSDYVDPSEYEALNTACLDAGLPWTSIRHAGFEVNIGPTIIPGQTPCHTCYDLRRKSNLTNYEEYVLFERHQRVNHDVPVSLSMPFGIDLAAIEVIKAITRFTQPATLAHVFSLNVLTMESRLHPVLRIPRCPACGTPSRNSPPVQPWQRFEEH